MLAVRFVLIIYSVFHVSPNTNRLSFSRFLLVLIGLSFIAFSPLELLVELFWFLDMLL